MFRRRLGLAWADDVSYKRSQHKFVNAVSVLTGLSHREAKIIQGVTYEKNICFAGALFLVGFLLSLTGCVHFPWHGIGH